MPSLTVENYLKAILQAVIRTEQDWVSTGQLATALGVSPGTVTSMVKALAESGLVDYRPYQGVRLTTPGQTLAVRILRRHRLIEQFLVKTLDLNWDEVHAEAENMEHAVSDALIDRIDAFLGYPEFDPHGDPIPAADGTMPGHDDAAILLAACPAGAAFTVVRVLRQRPDFLRYLTEQGLELGVQGHVCDNSAEADLIRIRIAERDVVLGHAAAETLLVTLSDPAADPG